MKYMNSIGDVIGSFKVYNVILQNFYHEYKDPPLGKTSRMLDIINDDLLS